MKAFT
jgi:serine/threonine-protein phosphatase 2A regulatory subunit B'